MAQVVSIRTGEVPPHTPGAAVPPEGWGALLHARREVCNGQFQTDCRALVFYIEDGRANKFFGYPDEETYCREGLWLEPEAVRFAVAYLAARKERLRGNAVSFAEAAALGRAQLAEQARATPVQNRRGRRSKGNVDNVKIRDGGNSRSYILERLATHRPDLLTAYEAGEFKSARAAAIAAGFIKQPSPLDQLRKAWKRATPKQRKAFLAEVS